MRCDKVGAPKICFYQHAGLSRLLIEKVHPICLRCSTSRIECSYDGSAMGAEPSSGSNTLAGHDTRQSRSSAFQAAEQLDLGSGSTYL